MSWQHNSGTLRYDGGHASFRWGWGSESIFLNLIGLSPRGTSVINVRVGIAAAMLYLGTPSIKMGPGTAMGQLRRCAAIWARIGASIRKMLLGTATAAFAIVL